MTSEFRIVPAGDSVLIVELEERIDPRINARAIAIAAAVEAAAIPGVRDVVTTYRSVAVYFDPLRTDYDALNARLDREANGATSTEAGRTAAIEIPVCYEGDLGPDLPAVAALAKLTEPEVVARHTAIVYRVFMLGFVPGFAYMGTVDPTIAVPRHSTPRVRVPLGSVGIAGVQTGIYPAETPGGWQIIGRTPLKPFDPSRPQPFLFRAGDQVRFVSIERAEFDRLAGGER